jgi:hypothetical protein
LPRADLFQRAATRRRRDARIVGTFDPNCTSRGRDQLGQPKEKPGAAAGLR